MIKHKRKARLTSAWAFLDHHTWAAAVEGEACGKADQVLTRTGTQQSALAKWLQEDWSSSALQDLKGQISTSTLGQEPLEEHNSPLGEGRPRSWKYWGMSLTLSMWELLWTSVCAALHEPAGLDFLTCTELPREGMLQQSACDSSITKRVRYHHWWVSLTAEAYIREVQKAKKIKESKCALKKSQIVARNIAHVFTLMFLFHLFSIIPTIGAQLIETIPKHFGLLKTSENNPNYGFTAPLSSITESQSVKYFAVRAETPQWQGTGDFEDTKSILEGFKREVSLSFAAQDCHSMGA